MNNNDVQILKRYFTEILTDPLYKTFDGAQKHAIRFRSTVIEHPRRKMLFIAPLLYRFHTDMEIPADISRLARTVILSVLHNSVDSGSIDAYTDALSTYQAKDKNELTEVLFLNYHDLLELEAYITEIEEDKAIADLWIEGMVGVKETLLRYIRILGLVDDLEVFLERQREKKKAVVMDTLHKAYWDVFDEKIAAKDYTTLILCLDEIRTMITSIVGERSGDISELLDSAYIVDQLEKNIFPMERVEDLFRRVMTILRDADSIDFIPIYDKKRSETGKTTAYYFETLYIMTISLKTKIDAYRRAASTPTRPTR
jgi:hypothetical protein